MISKHDIEAALKLIDEGEIKAVGYRVLLFPLQTREGMEKAEADKYETLAAMGFQTETNDQKEREDKGNYYHIVLGLGESTYQDERLGRDPWIKPGDIAVTERYGGVAVEWPPGSGQNLRFINDENILGKMETKHV